MKKRLRRSLKAVAAWCKAHRHEPVKEQQAALNAKLRGHYQYYGRVANYHSVWKFYRGVQGIWKKWVNRRTRGATLTWEKYNRLLARYPLVLPRIVHQWPSRAVSSEREPPLLGETRGPFLLRADRN
jgi:RNA-directed DNA polymerase